jgi:hypothetical protein
LQLRAVQPDSIDLALDLSGGWDAQRGWAGTMQKLVNHGRYAVNLVASAPLEAGPSLFSLHAVRLELIGGTLNIDELRWVEGQLQTSGSAQGLSLAYVQQLRNWGAAMRYRRI